MYVLPRYIMWRDITTYWLTRRFSSFYMMHLKCCNCRRGWCRYRYNLHPCSVCLPWSLVSPSQSLTTLCWSLCWDSPQSIWPWPALACPLQYVNTIIASRLMLVCWWWWWWWWWCSWGIFTPSCWLLAILKSVDPQDNLLALNSQIRVDCSRHLLCGVL